MLSFCFLLSVICYLPLQKVTAAYVLPYPSYMPGNKLYRVSRVIDEAKKYWYWGNLASYRYELEQSDKALVEAKILFEYNQYLLALDALERSNIALPRVSVSLRQARDEGKNIEKYKQEFMAALEEHKRLIVKIKKDVPEEFTWTPEKKAPQVLGLHAALSEAERIRSDALPKLP